MELLHREPRSAGAGDGADDRQPEAGAASVGSARSRARSSGTSTIEVSSTTRSWQSSGRSSVVGTWNAKDATGASCKVSLSSAPALDLYKATSSGDAATATASASARSRSGLATPPGSSTGPW